METQAKRTEGGPSGLSFKKEKEYLASGERAASSRGRRNQKQNKENFNKNQCFKNTHSDFQRESRNLEK